MGEFKERIRSLVNFLGYDFYRIKGCEPHGVDPFRDLKYLVTGSRPTIFDVGANVGQSVSTFRRFFPGSVIHAFEPGSEAFAKLCSATTELTDLHLNNFALGAKRGSGTFLVNSCSDMSSFLKPGADGWGEVRGTSVEISTLDDYCRGRGITGIDILKIDTQGYDLEVLRGAEGLISSEKIKSVFMEINMAGSMYEGCPLATEIITFMRDRAFRLEAMYYVHYSGACVWTDGLFVHRG